MAKRNRKAVVGDRWEKKKKKGRIVDDKFQEERLPPIQAKTPTQKELFKALNVCDLVVAQGCAGVGKTYAVAGQGADYLKDGTIDKICVSRPYVGMGRAMGFRPGSEYDKLLPFVLPIFDVFKERLGKNCLQSQVELENIELVPFETIRGRSFNNAWVMIDEAQNATVDEIKSVVTRIGENSKLILMGDLKQCDLKEKSGLAWVIEMIDKYNVPDSRVINFTIDDCVRSDICANFLRIIDWEAE